MLAVAWETKNHVNFQTMMSFNLPLLKWLGVGFHTRNIKFTYLLVSDIFWWFFNLAMLCLFLRYEFPFLFDGTVNSKKVDRLVGPINYATHTFLIFLGTWWMSRFHGPALWTSLLQIGDHVRISSKDVSYCHRAAKAHLFLIFVGMLLHLSISIVDINKGTTKGNGWDSILFLISLMPYTYSLLAIVLFVNLGRIIRISFRSMVMELKEKKALPYLSIWEHEKQFSIITRAANDLQNSFALILFLTVFYALTGFIMASYNLFRFFQELPGLPDHICVYCKMGKLIFFVIEHLIRLWLICHTPDEIHYEAYSLVSVLQDIRNQLYCRRWLVNVESEEVHAFILEVSETCPSYEIYGMFSLTKKIIVSLVSNTLTYLVVLSQFTTNTNQAPVKPK